MTATSTPSTSRIALFLRAGFPGRWGFYIACIWTVASLIWAVFLGQWVLYAAIVGLALAWIYSAPPLRLKQNGWWGNSAVGLAYEGLPWFTGAAVVAAGLPDAKIITLAILYSLGAHGIMTLNDFKSIEGDRRLGVRSLPVQLGVRRAVQLACIVMAAPQVVVIGLLAVLGTPDLRRCRGRAADWPVHPDAPAHPESAQMGDLLQRHGNDVIRHRHVG